MALRLPIDRPWLARWLARLSCFCEKKEKTLLSVPFAWCVCTLFSWSNLPLTSATTFLQLKSRQSHENCNFVSRTNLASQHHCLFWGFWNLHYPRIFLFPLIIWMFREQIRQTHWDCNNKRQHFINQFCGFIYIDRVSSPGAISFHISLYFRNCFINDTVFRSVLYSPVSVFLAINFKVKHISVINKTFLSTQIYTL